MRIEKVIVLEDDDDDVLDNFIDLLYRLNLSDYSMIRAENVFWDFELDDNNKGPTYEAGIRADNYLDATITL